jgi:hypothetical protein
MTASPTHVTLTANTVTTVTLDGDPYGAIEILNVDGSAAIYLTVNGSDPIVEGNGCNVLPAAIGGLTLNLGPGRSTTTVKLISAGTPKVSIRNV